MTEQETLSSDHEQRLLGETLAEITLSLTSQINHSAVLDEILRQAKRLVPYTTAHIMLLDKDTLRIARWSGHEALGKQAFISNLVQSLSGLPLDSKAVEQRYPVVTPDTHADPDWLQFEETAWIRSHLVMPLCWQDKVVGLLRMNSDKPGQFQEQDAKRLIPLGQAAAVALENAQLLQTAERRAAELDEIRRATLVVTSRLELQAVLEAILQSTVKLLTYVEDAIIFLYEDGRLQDGAAFWKNPPLGDKIIPPRPQGITYTVAQTGQSIVVSDIQKDVLYTSSPISWSGSLVGLALKVRDRVVGVMNVHNPNPHEWTEAELRVLYLLADQAAIAIENARLYEHAQQEIAERKRAEVALKMAHDELALRVTELLQANEELEKLAYVMSHDLRSPIRGIVRLTEWLEEDLSDLPETAHENMQLLRRRAYRMEALVEGIMQYLRTGRSQSRLERVDTKELIHQIVNLLDVPHGFTISVGEGMPVFITERVALKQVFDNLLSNALKHHDKVNGRIEVAVLERDEFYEFAIQDNGPGIPAEFHEKIFVIFQTLSRRDDIEGSGVGLALVKKIVEGQGGHVWLESPDGVGTKFVFTWPKTPRERVNGVLPIL